MASSLSPTPSPSIECVLKIQEDGIRHSQQISREEIESMVVYVHETKKYTPADSRGWDCVIDSPEFNFIKRIDDATNLVRTRSWIKIPRVPPQVLFHILLDPKERVSFDKYYRRFEVSRTVSSELDVLISEVDAPIGVSNREFVEWRRILVPESPSISRKDAVYAIQLRSCDDVECSQSILPRSKRLERAETWLSGYVMSWWLDPETNEALGSEILVMSQIDMRGLLPQLFVNMVGAVSAPTKWCRSLIDASQKFCKSSGIHSDMTDKEIEEKLKIVRIGRTDSKQPLAAAELREKLEEVVGLPPLPITSKKVLDGAAIVTAEHGGNNASSPTSIPTAIDDTITYDCCTVGSNDPTYAASSDADIESQMNEDDTGGHVSSDDSVLTAVTVFATTGKTTQPPPKVAVIDCDGEKVLVPVTDHVEETVVVPEGLRYFLTSGTVSLVGISLLAFSLTLTIWNTWRAITYVYSPLDTRIALRCSLNLGLCVFAIVMVLMANKNWFGNLGRGIRVLGNVLGGIGLWELIESLVSYLTDQNSKIDLIIYAVWLLLCTITVYALYKWRNINIIDSSLLSPV